MTVPEISDGRERCWKRLYGSWVKAAIFDRLSVYQVHDYRERFVSLSMLLLLVGKHIVFARYVVSKIFDKAEAR